MSPAPAPKQMSPETLSAQALVGWASASARVEDFPCQTRNVHLDPEQKAEARAIASELAAIARSGRVLPGSITKRRTRCGRANCACRADPPRLHGPYWHWTRKVAARPWDGGSTLSRPRTTSPGSTTTDGSKGLSPASRRSALRS